MVSTDEYGSHIAEYEGFRDTLMDEISTLRESVENLKEELKDIRKILSERKG
jgi:hypothetical protein